MLLCIAKILLVLIGFVVVPILLPFRKIDKSSWKENGWMFCNISGWFGNNFDGLYGDKRGDWISECRAKGRNPYGYLSMYLWSALRNPVNAWSRSVAACDVSECKISKILGDDVVVEEPSKGGKQVLLAVSPTNKYFRVFFVIPWFFNPNKAILLDLGWKIKLSHNNITKDSKDSEKYKGLVLVFSLWKSLK